ncbi:MAG: DUF1080 domain-containing protein [Pseudohongiellaceae bacterium]|jgi:Domain of Unknown Function (DUF1080)
MKLPVLVQALVFTVVTLPVQQVLAAEAMTHMSGSFAGWRQIGTANWRIENDEFVADMGNGHLVTEVDYQDFHITAEFWVNEGANSGIFLRASNKDEIRDTNAYEANIYDNRPDQSGRTGGLVNFAAPTTVINTPDKWSTYDITVQGDHIVIKLNGVTTVDIHDATYASGPISLQYGAGTVKFRNVMIGKL